MLPQRRQRPASRLMPVYCARSLASEDRGVQLCPTNLNKVDIASSTRDVEGLRESPAMRMSAVFRPIALVGFRSEVTLRLDRCPQRVHQICYPLGERRRFVKLALHLP